METNNRTAPVVQEKERNQVSLDLMRRMRLNGMAAAFYRESVVNLCRNHDTGWIPLLAFSKRMGLPLFGSNRETDTGSHVPL